MKRRVVITGMGVVAPLGTSVESFWNAVVEGRSGVRTLEAFDASPLKVGIGGEVRGFDARRFVRDRKSVKVMGKHTQFAVAASAMAMAEAGLSAGAGAPDRLGVFLGSAHESGDFHERNDLWTRMRREDGGEAADMGRLWEIASSHSNPLGFLCSLPNGPAAHVAILHDAQGPNCSLLTPDVAGTQAIGEAARLIAHGDADVMIAGGTASDIEVEKLLMFGRLGALSQRAATPEKASRPFDRERDGLVLGEGAGLVVLESLPGALDRGATILGELCGYASTFGPAGAMGEDGSGPGLAASMRLALAEAQTRPDEVSYLAAHGTSTVAGDRGETDAIKSVFGTSSRRLAVSSTKSMLGYLNTAAGAVDLIVCLLAMRDGVIPPTINYEHPDPECDLDYVPNLARRTPVRVAMSNAAAPNGAAATLVVRRYAA